MAAARQESTLRIAAKVTFLGSLDRPVGMQSIIAPRFPTSVPDGTTRECSLINPMQSEGVLDVRHRMAVSATLNPSQTSRQDSKAHEPHISVETLDALAEAFGILDRHLDYWMHRRKASRTPTTLIETRRHLEVLTDALNNPGTASVLNVRRAYIALRDGSVSRAIRTPPIHSDSSADAESLRKRAILDRINFKHAVARIRDTVAALILAAAETIQEPLSSPIRISRQHT